jgi:hypothetical protein
MLKAFELHELPITTAEQGSEKVEVVRWRVNTWLRKTVSGGRSADGGSGPTSSGGREASDIGPVLATTSAAPRGGPSAGPSPAVDFLQILCDGELFNEFLDTVDARFSSLTGAELAQVMARVAEFQVRVAAAGRRAIH